jgi:adenylate kinase
MGVQLIFLGAPGSGKGTQAKKLVSDHNFKHVSTGDLLRSEVAKGSPLGIKINGVLRAGELVNNDLVLDLLAANCDVKHQRFIFDGYPRNLEQAIALDKKILGSSKKKAIYFKVDIENLVARLTNRRTCSKCGAIYNLQTHNPKKKDVCDLCSGVIVHRDDDKEATIRKRMDVFSREISTLLGYYSKQNVLLEVDATASAEEVYRELVAVLG